MKAKKKYFADFKSPGTFFTEQTSVEIDAPKPELAVKEAAKVVERYGAKPFGFKIRESLAAPPIDDGYGGKLIVESRTISESGTYFITGELRTLDEIKAKNSPDERILVGNMECNGWPIVIENRNSFRSTLPFTEADFIVNWKGKIIKRGDEPELVKYRQETIERVKAERGY